MSKHVLLAVGHGLRPDGAFDPGATHGARSEQTTCDIIVAQAAALLRSWGVRVTDEAYRNDPNYSGTVAAANRLDDLDLVVAAHRDWSRGIEGIFGFWYPKSKKGEDATRAIVSACAGAGFTSVPSWVKARSDLTILSRTRAPATLIEYGRVQDYDEADLEKLGEATAFGIAGFLGVKIPAPRSTGAGFNPSAAEQALLEIKSLVGVPVGQGWDAADYPRIVDGVKKAVGS